MKMKQLIIFAIVMLFVLNLSAIRSVTFLKNGSTVTNVLIDISSRTGMIDYKNGRKVNRTNVWMINYQNGKWNFPDERRKLAANKDTIFLRNGGVQHVRIVDFSSRLMRFEFANGGKVHESAVRRIYFCCTKFPPAYKRRLNQDDGGGSGSDAKMTAFMVDGRTSSGSISYYTNRKTGFSDGLQVNSKDIWMINFEDDNYDHPTERRQLSRRVDTLFMQDGNVIKGNIQSYDSNQSSFQVDGTGDVHITQIKRIYFCCNSLPEAFRRNPRKGQYNKYRKKRR